jgi:hypothetical protein
MTSSGETTQARWSILRGALLNRRSVAKQHEKVTRRPVGRFGLVQVERVEEESDQVFETLNYKIGEGKTISLRCAHDQAVKNPFGDMQFGW